MKTLTCLLLFLSTLALAAQKPYFIYGDMHSMGAYPMVGVGFRAQTGIHAFDISANICPLNPPRTLGIYHFRSLYLYYPTEQHFYLGGGLGLLREPENIQISGSLESSIGYQWENKMFLEGNAIVPFKQSDRLAPIWPAITVGFGY